MKLILCTGISSIN